MDTCAKKSNVINNVMKKVQAATVQEKKIVMFVPFFFFYMSCSQKIIHDWTASSSIVYHIPHVHVDQQFMQINCSNRSGV